MASNNPHYTAEEVDPKTAAESETQQTFQPRQLSIVWGNDTRYWRLPDKQRPNGPAELLQVCWLEVTGSFSGKVKAGKKYKVGFSVSLKGDAFGWSGCPVYVMAKVGKKGRYFSRKTDLVTSTAGDPYVTRKNLEIDVTATSADTIYFGLYEVWSGRWKGGLLIHQAYVQEMP